MEVIASVSSHKRIGWKTEQIKDRRACLVQDQLNPKPLEYELFCFTAENCARTCNHGRRS